MPCSEFGRRLEQTAIEKGRRLIGDRNHLGKTRPDLLDLFRGPPGYRAALVAAAVEQGHLVLAVPALFHRSSSLAKPGGQG
jgi:hypothetical protein